MMDLITEHIATWTGAEIPKANGGRGRGRGSNGQSPHGIKKLRELILELAVRGKLVPQDPKDEPASVLLEKIAKEKARLIKEGKIKKDTSLPEISEDEKPYELPKGWGWTRLGNVTDYGFSEKAEPGSVSEDTWILELEDVEKDTSKLLQKVRVADRQFRSSKNVFSKGDVIYGKLRPYLDKVIVADENGICTTEMVPLKGYAHIASQYLRLVMKSPCFIRYANDSTHGMNLPRMGTEKARLALFPITSKAEQHRIVAKVDELMALCDKLEQQQADSNDTHQTLVETLLATLTTVADPAEFAVSWQRIVGHFDTLFTTEESIDQLKQTILQLAVMGKLVPQNPNDEPASTLLEKIAKEKAKLIKEGKIKKQKTLPKISEDEKPFDLPVGWGWVRLDDLALRSEAGWSPNCEPTPRKDNDWGVLKVSAVSWGQYNPDENKALPANLRPRPEFEVFPDDFLISRANTSELVARAVIVPKETPPRLMMSDKIIRFVFSRSSNTQFVNLANGSSSSREYYSRVAGGTSSSMKNVSRDQIRMLLIALPPLAEQHRIVAKVDELLALCDTLKERLHDAKITQVQLADAIVEQAVA
ncbi:MAG: restriction endonuclease subunit S [Desulfurivibrionaceae bacterium]|jgi:type I restriction enzyme S subunit